MRFLSLPLLGLSAGLLIPLSLLAADGVVKHFVTTQLSRFLQFSHS